VNPCLRVHTVATVASAFHEHHAALPIHKTCTPRKGVIRCLYAIDGIFLATLICWVDRFVLFTAHGVLRFAGMPSVYCDFIRCIAIYYEATLCVAKLQHYLLYYEKVKYLDDQNTVKRTPREEVIRDWGATSSRRRRSCDGHTQSNPIEFEYA
jgi:hypothetical protein